MNPRVIRLWARAYILVKLLGYVHIPAVRVIMTTTESSCPETSFLEVDEIGYTGGDCGFYKA